MGNGDKDARLSFTEKCEIEQDILSRIKSIHDFVLSGKRDLKQVETWLQVIISHREFIEYLDRKKLEEKAGDSFVQVSNPKKLNKKDNACNVHGIFAKTTKISEMILSGKRKRMEVLEWLDVLVRRPDFISFLDTDKIKAKEKDIYAKSLEFFSKRYIRWCDFDWCFGSKPIPLNQVVFPDKDISAFIRYSIHHNHGQTFEQMFGKTVIAPEAEAHLSSYTFDGCMKGDKLVELFGEREIVTTWSQIIWAIYQQQIEKSSQDGDTGLISGANDKNVFFVRDDLGEIRKVTLWNHGYWETIIGGLKDTDDWYGQTRFILPIDLKSEENHHRQLEDKSSLLSGCGSFYEKVRQSDLDKLLGLLNFDNLFDKSYSRPKRTDFDNKLRPIFGCELAKAGKQLDRSDEEFVVEFGTIENTVYLKELIKLLGGEEKATIPVAMIAALIASQLRSKHREGVEAFARSVEPRRNERNEGALNLYETGNLIFVRDQNNVIVPIEVFWHGDSDYDACWNARPLSTGRDVRGMRVFYRVPVVSEAETFVAEEGSAE